MRTAALRNVEGKYRTSAETKDLASEVYARWGLSLSDAINVFLVKSIQVGGFPFDMRDEGIPFDRLAATAYQAPLDKNGIAVLPSHWDDEDE